MSLILIKVNLTGFRLRGKKKILYRKNPEVTRFIGYGILQRHKLAIDAAQWWLASMIFQLILIPFCILYIHGVQKSMKILDS